MRLLDRYILKQVLISALFAIAVIIIILVLGNVFKEILRELAKRPDLDLWFVAKFIALVIPISLSLAVPFSFLTSILLTFGRLSADSEFVSMRMAGLSMGRICVPVWILAAFFTGVCAWVNLSLTPMAKTEMEGMKDTLINKAKVDPLMLFPDEQVMDEFGDYLIWARKEDGLLRNFQMIKMDKFMPDALAIADSAEITVDLDSDKPAMLMTMKNANLMIKTGGDSFMESSQPLFMEEAQTAVSLEDLKKNDERLQPENLGLIPLVGMVGDKTLESNVRATLRTELSMRMAFSVSCITFGLIGVPLGITAQRRETTSGFVLSMVIAVVYYVLLIIAQMMRENESLYPHVLVWVPNILFVALGLIMFRRLSKK